MDDKKERSEKLKGVCTQAESIEEGIEKTRGSITGYGLCSNCIHFICVENDFGDAIVKCDWYELTFRGGRISKNKPVTKCTKFWDKKYAKIRDLEAMAYIIDIKPNEPIGFLKPSYIKRWETYD